MEIFVDFGLFEVLAATGTAAMGRAIYRRPAARVALLIATILAPLALVFLAPSELLRWIAAIALATGLLNVSIIASLSRAVPVGQPPPVHASR